MKKLLILFANGFPFGISEPFLENEYPLYSEYFDKVLIVTPCKKGERPTREIADPAIEILPDYTLSKDRRSVLEAIPCVLTDRMFYRELVRWMFRERCSLRKLYYLIVYALCGNHQALLVHRWLKRHPEYRNPVLYSYWMQVPAYAAVRLKHRLKKQCYAVSRAHGGDLYLERHEGVGHLPYHRSLYEDLDEIAVISEHGKQYLESHYGDLGKVSVHRLGAVDRGCHNPHAARDVLRIVTCSRTIPLKRLNRLVDALAQIGDIPIHWTHMGGGEAQEALERYAAEKLPSNVTASFSGTVPNTQIYETYKTQPFHVFVNVSETEGVPVAVMEAMSFDIPVIATAVGGTPELIEDGKNGFLLPAEFSDDALVSDLRMMMEMPEERYLSLRHEARRKYEREYHAERNYRLLMEHIAGMYNECYR